MGHYEKIAGAIEWRAAVINPDGEYLIRNCSGQGWGIPTNDLRPEDLRAMADHLNQVRARCAAPMPFYVASKTCHAHRWQQLRAAGHAVTATWIDEAGKGESADYAELADRCRREIQAASFVLLYCEPGETLKGALVEAGMALALGKPVRCVGQCDSLSRVFNRHPLWRAYDSVAAAVEDC